MDCCLIGPVTPGLAGLFMLRVSPFVEYAAGGQREEHA